MKFFKTIALIVVLNDLYTANAQMDSSGVYKTGSDYSNQKLSFAIDCRTESHKIKLNDFFGKNYITVVHNGTSYKLIKADIFGFKTCEGQIIRFLDKKELVLINPGESIMIYRHDVVKAAKGITNATNYYFSKDAISSPQSLTINNLKRAFPENHSFHEKLDGQFKYNTELASYDDYHKMYKINWLLQTNSQ